MLALVSRRRSALAIGLVLLSLARIVASASPEADAETATEPTLRVAFQDVSALSGVAGFSHFSYGYGGDGLAGVAWLDYNNDGLLDLYFTNGKDITNPDSEGFDNALFENQGDGTFTDVAALRGVTHGEGSAGVVAADIDNDGDQDIFLTGDGGMLGHDTISGAQTVDSGVALYRNDGPPAYNFSRMDNDAAGLIGLESTMSAALADVDGDGLLDIFVAAPGTRPAGCQPPPSCNPDDPTVLKHSSRMFLNRTTDGVIDFVDVSDVSGIGASKSGALATAFSDFDRDGRIDLLVANGVTNIFEPTPVQLYANLGFNEVLQSPEFADITDSVNLSAQSAWMGIAPGDFDGDGAVDLFITNMGGNLPHALYRFRPAFSEYIDVAAITGVSGQSPGPSDYFGWGCTAQDFDNDGRSDLFFAGSPPPQEGPSNWNPGTLLLNDPPAVRFHDFSAALDVDLSDRFTSGVAAADFDNDGRVDIAVATDDNAGDLGKPVLLQNQTQNDNRWVTIRLTGNGTTTNRDAVGARVAVVHGQPPERAIQMREVYAGSSFLSMDSKWLTFGLGPITAGTPLWVAVDWPDGPHAPGQQADWVVYGPFAPDGIVDIAQ